MRDVRIGDVLVDRVGVDGAARDQDGGAQDNVAVAVRHPIAVPGVVEVAPTVLAVVFRVVDADALSSVTALHRHVRRRIAALHRRLRRRVHPRLLQQPLVDDVVAVVRPPRSGDALHRRLQHQSGRIVGVAVGVGDGDAVQARLQHASFEHRRIRIAVRQQDVRKVHVVQAERTTVSLHLEVFDLARVSHRTQRVGRIILVVRRVAAEPSSLARHRRRVVPVHRRRHLGDVHQFELVRETVRVVDVVAQVEHRRQIVHRRITAHTLDALS